MYKCPQCGSDEIRVEALAVCRIEQHADAEPYPELEDFDGISMDDDSVAMCVGGDCDYTAPLRNFSID